MELGSLELQIFVSLIVILGTAFVALVCDYLKGSNESLREHNIELRVRKEEQEKHRAVEAVEWLQHLLGATQRNPVRMGSTRPVAARKRPAAVPAGVMTAGGGKAAPSTAPSPAPAAMPAVAQVAARRPIAAQAPAVAAAPVVPAPAVAPAAAVQSPAVRSVVRPVPAAPAAAVESLPAAVQTRIPETPEAVPAAEPAAAMASSEASKPEEAPRGSRLAAARLRREAGRRQSATSLLDSLPVPAWVKKEQEEKAALAAGANRTNESVAEEAQPEREPMTRPFANPLPPVTEPEPQPAAATAEKSSFTWTYVPSGDAVAETPAAPVSTPTPAATPAPEPAVATAAAPVAKSDSFWSYRGLVDRMVAATANAFSPSREEVAPLLPEVPPAQESSPAEAILMPPVTPVAEEEPQQAAAQALATPDPDPAPVAEIDVAPVAEIDVAIEPVVVVDEAPAAPLAPEPVVEEEPYVSVLLEPLPEPVAVYTEEPPAHILAQQQQQQPQPHTPSTVIPFAAPAAAASAEVSIASVTQQPAQSPLPALELPAGFHDRSVLNSFMQSSDVLTGVVVAIGINDYSHHAEKLGHGPMQDLMRNVEQMIGGMLRPNLDFGCRSTDDEFILVFVNEVGSDAQRRLSYISERLWNFQLRSLSNFSVLFSWGAVEVQNETLADAAASASERMYQTKRNRKTVSLDSQRRKLAVNL